MTTQMATRNTSGQEIERILMQGDLGKMNAEQRVEYIAQLCQALGLNPLMQPFQYITLQGRLTLYATKNATEQIAGKQGISTEIVSTEMLADDTLYKVHVRARKGERVADATGVVPLVNNNRALGGEALANALMKAETKAARRAVLRISGLGMLDETEVESVVATEPTPPTYMVNVETGEIIEDEKPALPQAQEPPKSDVVPTKSVNLAKKYLGRIEDASTVQAGNFKRMLEALGLPKDATQTILGASSVTAWCKERKGRTVKMAAAIVCHHVIDPEHIPAIDVPAEPEIVEEIPTLAEEPLVGREVLREENGTTQEGHEILW